MSELLDSGFDIYIKEDNSSYKYEELLTDNSFIKYEKGQNITIEKGYRRNGESMGNMPYLLVKEGTVIASMDFYGSMKEDMDIEDSKVIHICMDENCVASSKEKFIDIKFESMNLLDKLELEAVKEVFGKKLWLRPSGYNDDTTDFVYGIAWRTNSDSLFWNEYYCYIRFDENKKMREFTLSTSIARDKK